MRKATQSGVGGLYCVAAALLQRQQNHQQWTGEGHYLVTQLQL